MQITHAGYTLYNCVTNKAPLSLIFYLFIFYLTYTTFLFLEIVDSKAHFAEVPHTPDKY